jgi:hypothetical protein
LTYSPLHLNLQVANALCLLAETEQHGKRREHCEMNLDKIVDNERGLRDGLIKD